MSRKSSRLKPEYWLLVLAVAGIVFGTLAALGDRLTPSSAGLPSPMPPSRPTASEEEAWRIEDEQNTVQVFESAKWGVVKVTTSRSERVYNGSPISSRKGNGSGFFVDRQGHVVTNYHVIEDATNIEVQTISGRSYAATVAGADRLTDLAVLSVEIPETEVYPLVLADYSLVRVGQKAIVLGSPLATGSSMGLDRSPTVTTGIISAKDRSMPIESLTRPNVNDFTIEDLVQTDAAVNPGNSGGPLLNSNGEVVGVVTAIMDAANGIGFAIPSQVVGAIVPELILHGKVVRAYMGVSYHRLDEMNAALGDAAFSEAGYPPTWGALVTGIDEGSPAEKAGLRPCEEVVIVGGTELPFGGDIIVGLDGVPITGSNLSNEILKHKPGDRVVAEVLRGNRKVKVELILGSR
ncbi:MAG: S1C family serine protease [Bacillota bacterium]